MRTARHARARRLLALIGVALSVLTLHASAAETPIPPRPSRFITDDAQLLSAAQRSALDARLEAYERSTGHQVVVWIGQTIGERPLDEFAVKTFEAWKLGRKGHDDGLLMIVLARDRKIDIEVGYGLEDRVPDAIASRIIREVMAPRLAAGDADGAIASGVDAVLSAIEGKPFAPTAAPSGRPPEGRRPQMGPESQPPPRAAPSIARLVVYGILAILFLILFITHPDIALALMFSLGGRGGGGGGFGGGFSGGGGRSGGGGARGSW